MVANRKVKSEAPEEDGPPPEQVQATARIEGETCPRCRGGRVYADLRFNKRTGVRTSRACLGCWHTW